MATSRSELAQRIKEAVPLEEAVRLYGFEPNRNGFLPCPFHSGDREPSLKLYPNGRGWYCYGCHKGGSVIDFVKELYGLTFPQALLRLDADFHLGLVGTEPDPAQKAALAARRKKLEEEKQARAEYTAHWERSVELTRDIDLLSDRVMELLAEREACDRWLDEHEKERK